MELEAKKREQVIQKIQQQVQEKWSVEEQVDQQRMKELDYQREILKVSSEQSYIKNELDQMGMMNQTLKRDNGSLIQKVEGQS